MAMRIRQNPTSLSTLRHATNHFDKVKGSIERLSSGVKINKGSDGPASLIASERLRGRIVGLQQAYNNASSSVSLMQTAEGALNEVSGILVRLNQLAVHAQNEAINNTNMLNADQMEVEQLLTSIDRIAQNTIFGGKKLLDGSMGANGATVGDHLRFVKAQPDTPTSPEQGWEIDIQQVATRAKKIGSVPLDTNNVRGGVNFVLSEGGKNITMNTRDGQLGKDIDQILRNVDSDPVRFPPDEMSSQIRGMTIFALQQELDANGLELDVFETPDKKVFVRHKQFGDSPSFSVTSSVAGVLSDQANVAQLADQGKNVEGTINGEVALGDAQFLTALEGTTAAGVTIEYSKEIGLKEIPVLDESGARIGTEFVEENNEDVVGSPASPKLEGYVHVSQMSKEFQVGVEPGLNPSFSFTNVRTNRLGNGILNESGFQSLADVDVRTTQGAKDAAKIINTVIDEVSVFRGKLGAFQKNTVESNLNSLKIAEENITQAESTLRDADMAQEMSNLTKDQIMLQASTAMVAQANQVPQTVLGLIQSGG